MPADTQEGLSIRPQTLHFTPQYRRLRDTFLRPHLRITESRYFWEKWKPRLGPDAAVLIMEVRDRCNRALSASLPVPGQDVSDSLDGCTVSASELGAACGFSRVTLWRLLQREDVRRFVRVEHNYIYDQRLGKKRRTVSTYHVLMEDPLVDEDEARLHELLAAGQVAPVGITPPPPNVHSETKVVERSAPTLQVETNRSGSILKRQNVSETLLKERLAGNGELASLPIVASSGQQSAEGPTRAIPEVDLWSKYPDIAHHVEEAERLLGDTHSRGFYIKTLKRLHPGYLDVWQRALTVAREQTNIRRSRGALFARLLRTFAAEAGVDIQQ